MNVTVLLSLEGADPEISRCVNVDSAMHLGHLSAVIDAAFGFSGAATHLYTQGEGGFRKLYTAHPGPGELSETSLSVGEITPMTYIYDPAANWNIAVELLGPTQLDSPTPALVDAAGPDIVEAAHGPAMMTKFRIEARRIAAGLAPNMEITPLLLSYLPVMSPERILQRLTVADQVAVATRISLAAEELFYGEEFAKAPFHQADLAEEFENFLDSRPDLREIIQTDPEADRNPTLLAAVADFFDSHLGEPEVDFLDEMSPDLMADFPGAFEEATMDDVVRDLMEIFLDPVKLTAKKGQLPTAVVQEISDVLNITSWYSRPTETSIPGVHEVRKLLEGAGFIGVTSKKTLEVTDLGFDLLNSIDMTGVFIPEWARGFEHAFGETLWRESLTTLGNMFNLGTEYGIENKLGRMPENFSDVVSLLISFAALDDSSKHMAITPEARRMFGRMLSWYEHGI